MEKLKARAYDLIAQMNYFQRELEEVNKQIVNYKPEVVEPKEEEN